MNSNSPVGIFDSGLGGLSVAYEIRKQMPHEHLLFFGDSAHNPYGTKTKEEVQELSMNIVKTMQDQGVKAVVIACNTATSAAAPLLREHFDFDVIGMEPALKVAAEMKTPSKIAVWATELTLREDKFCTLKERFVKDHDIVSVACPKLVELVEKDALDDEQTVQSVLMEYLRQSEHPDVIVLGCTHFVHFKDALTKLVDDSVQIVDGNAGTARQLRRLLEKRNLLNTCLQEGSLRIENSDPGKIEQSWRLYQRMEDEYGSKEKCLAEF